VAVLVNKPLAGQYHPKREVKKTDDTQNGQIVSPLTSLKYRENSRFLCSSGRQAGVTEACENPPR